MAPSGQSVSLAALKPLFPTTQRAGGGRGLEGKAGLMGQSPWGLVGRCHLGRGRIHQPSGFSLLLYLHPSGRAGVFPHEILLTSSTRLQEPAARV